MMKRIFYALCLLLGSFSSNAQQATLHPIDFSDRLALIVDTLYVYGDKWGTKLKEVATSKKFHELAPHRKNIETYVNNKIAQLKVMPDVANSKDMRMAMINFLEYQKQVIEKGFKPFEKLNTVSTQKLINAVNANLKTFSQKETGELQKFAEFQEKYAKENQFSLDR